jgi:PIN domain nuclease of toxin-antitoxin system
VRVLLDTHALIWFAFDDIRLSKPARSVLLEIENEVFVSAASAWELTTKVRIGKLPVAAKFAIDLRSRVRGLGFQELAVTVEHGQRAGLLPGAHKDPFDRMLIAQAQAENLAIVSKERVFDEYHVRRIW